MGPHGCVGTLDAYMACVVGLVAILAVKPRVVCGVELEDVQIRLLVGFCSLLVSMNVMMLHIRLIPVLVIMKCLVFSLLRQGRLRA